MSECLHIVGGHVVDPHSGRDETGDVYAVDGRFVASLTTSQRKTAKQIDATGLVVCPGLVDIHVHFRDPGQTHKETIASGSRAAAAGGFTTVVCMPNTAPVCDNAGTIQFIKDAVTRDAVIRVYPSGCLTLGMNGGQMAPIGSLKRAGVVAVTDDGRCIQSNELMRRVLEYAAMFELPVFDHCQDASLTEGAVMNEGDVSLKLGLHGWPAAAEDIIVMRNAILSHYTGAHVHLQHISSAHAVDLIRSAKAMGTRITAEATPHHLALTDESLLGYDTNFKMNPPLRTEDDRQALLRGIIDGTIDCIATDHAPHTDYEKDVEFDHAPNGIIGLETSLAVCLETLVNPGLISLAALIDLMTRKPAELCGLEAGTLAPGAPADITLFDPDHSWVYQPENSYSKSQNSPWNGKTMTGRVKTTIIGGQAVYEDGVIHSGRLPQPGGAGQIR